MAHLLRVVGGESVGQCWRGGEGWGRDDLPLLQLGHDLLAPPVEVIQTVLRATGVLGYRGREGEQERDNSPKKGAQGEMAAMAGGQLDVLR